MIVRSLPSVVAIAFAWSAMTVDVVAADLTVEVRRIAGGSGTINVRLYAGEAAWQRRRARDASTTLQVPAAQDAVRVTFGDLAPGRYAVTAYHDVNDDGRFNRSLGVFPLEPYALSNNLRPLAPPDFDDLAFDLPAAGTTILLDLIKPN